MSIIFAVLTIVLVLPGISADAIINIWNCVGFLEQIIKRKHDGNKKTQH